jgi:threonine dehydrogenase-like Zn-dependent dehydrogenase
MGQLLLMIAKHFGATVFVSEPEEYRRRMAVKLGADVVIDPQTEDLRSTILAVNNGSLV